MIGSFSDCRGVCSRSACVVALASCLLVALTTCAQDFGDHTSATLTGKAWKALADGPAEHVLAYTGKCRELYLAEAVKQQKSLTDFAPTDKAHDAWALNDVGTCLFIEGQVHEKAGQTAAAIEAYRTLADELKFSQCWDPKGWFWRPAEAAAGRIKQLEFDAKLD
jgi:hypothetical protein